MTNLTQFNDFALNTEETTNVNGGRCGSSKRRRTSCYSSNDCSYTSCEPTTEVEIDIIEVAPVIAAPVVETSQELDKARGIAAA